MTAAVDANFEWNATVAGRVLRCRPLADLAPHLFTTRDMSFRGPAAVDDQLKLATAMDLASREIVLVRQVRGAGVYSIEPGQRAEDIEADAIVSTDPGRAIAVRVADCVPVLLADRGHQ